MDIYNSIIVTEIEEVINSFYFEPCNNTIIHKLNMELCGIIKKYGIHDIFPYCKISDVKNHVSIQFKDSEGNCKLEFQI